VGKLVQLSSYGSKLKCFTRWRAGVGIVLKTEVIAGEMGYEVLWSGETRTSHMRIRDIKFVK